MRLRLLAVAVLLIIVAGQAVAALGGQRQYIVKTKHLIAQPHAKAAPSVQDVVRAGGGHVDYEWRDRLVVTLPDAAVQALVQHPAVEFVQQVVSGVSDTSTAAAASAGPVVTSSSFRPAPKSFPPWTSGTYSYDGQGNITAIGSNAYSYDAFSRLATSTTNGIPETYTYDRYGNLTQKVTGTGSTGLTVVSDVDDGNHLSAHCYDKGGNLTDDDPVHCPTATETYSFDALNRMTVKWNHTTHTKEYYVYNANDERIAVIPCSETACTEQITFSFRDESGKVLRQFEVPYQQFDSPWTWVEDYVYRDGVLLAAERVSAQGGRRYFHTDHLGTPRLITDSNGRRISEHDYFPFGVEATPLRQDTLPVNGFNREEPMKFTGHERDFSGGTSFENSNYIDYMHARSTVPQWGRFLSVDPVMKIEKAVKTPQSWNRYVYAGNSPINAIDPDGRETFKVNRRIGGGPPRAGWNFVSHTFVATTAGGLHTYSWGNTPDGKTKGKWFLDRPEDISAARQALAEGEVRKVGDDKLDPFVQKAFNEVSNNPNDRSNHMNLGCARNCKTEAGILLDRADELHQAAQKPQQPPPKNGILEGLIRFLNWPF